MVVFSASLAVLACVCAALPLAHLPGVEGAHLYGSRSMQTHSSSHSQHRSHSAMPATHSHDSGKHRGQRSPRFPPLLRRDRADDHKKAHDHPGQGSHDRTHAKGHRSAFARSRYRRASPHSSVYVSGEHGDRYLVSRAPPRKWEHGQSSHVHHWRRLDDEVLGRIDIMGATQSSDSVQRLASLTVDSTPIDWSSGQSSAKAFTMNASTSNQTQFIMMPVGDSSAGSPTKHVALATEVFDAGSTEMVMYCATYGSDPGSASALLMTPCTGVAQSAAQANDAVDPCANDASSTTHESQIFSFDPSSGRLEPISTTTDSSAVDNSADHPSSCGGARVRRDGNSTTGASSTSTSTAPTPSVSQSVRNVTLVYVAGALEVPASSPEWSSNTTTTTGAGQSAVLTTTITTTVVSTATASSSSAPSDRTVSPAQAAASVPVSPVPPVAGTATPSVSASSSSGSRSSTSSSSSVPATSTSNTSARGDQTLEVEIVGTTSSTTPSPPAASASGTTTTTTSSSSSASPPLNAQAVASSIENKMVHARRTFASAGGNMNPGKSVRQS